MSVYLPQPTKHTNPSDLIIPVRGRSSVHSGVHKVITLPSSQQEGWLGAVAAEAQALNHAIQRAECESARATGELKALSDEIGRMRRMVQKFEDAARKTQEEGEELRAQERMLGLQLQAKVCFYAFSVFLSGYLSLPTSSNPLADVKCSFLNCRTSNSSNNASASPRARRQQQRCARICATSKEKRSRQSRPRRGSTGKENCACRSETARFHATNPKRRIFSSASEPQAFFHLCRFRAAHAGNCAINAGNRAINSSTADIVAGCRGRTSGAEADAAGARDAQTSSSWTVPARSSSS
eukprot:3941718-Rhodomonas_salina.1